MNLYSMVTIVTLLVCAAFTVCFYLWVENRK